MIRWLLAVFAVCLQLPLAFSDQECAGCHQQEVSRWQLSHHAKAMLPVSAGSVAGRFDGSLTRYNGLAFRFTRQGDSYRVTVGEDAAARSYPVHYTFGFNPLQQYLARLPDGRYQALPVAWDARPAREGGQRWFALDSDLEWDHPGFSWNTSCASCHSTALKKGYDAASGAFDTRFDRVNVSCAACHGDSSGHKAWLEAGQPETEYAGFAGTLDERGEWHWLDDQAIASRKGAPDGQQLSSCGQCHSRRQQVGEWHPNSEVFDHLMPALITPPLYYADGQIRDEVFVLGSFLQSRMHAAGVVCSNCHEPHSTSLRAEGDGVCLQCHKADTFAVRDHHGHEPTSAACVDCHMPATVYMEVDPRRDHRFGIPDPALSEQLGSPNACRSCHADLSLEELAQRLPHKPGTSVQKTRHFARMMTEGIGRFDLHRIDSEYFEPMRQASLLSQLATQRETERAILVSKLQHQSPLVRAAAIRQLAYEPAAQRWRLLSHALDDPSQAVRMELAPVLAGAVPKTIDEPTRRRVEGLFNDYEALAHSQLDSPQMTVNFANYQLARGHREAARKLYERAVELDGEFVYPHLQLAAIARGTDRELQWLESARAVDHHSGEAAYQLGLYRIREQAYEKALAELKHAVTLAPQRSDFAYTYAVALENAGEVEAAIAVLAALEARGNASERTRDLQLRYLLKRGARLEAANLIERWLQAHPDSIAAQGWAQWLQDQ